MERWCAHCYRLFLRESVFPVIPTSMCVWIHFPATLILAQLLYMCVISWDPIAIPVSGWQQLLLPHKWKKGPVIRIANQTLFSFPFSHFLLTCDIMAFSVSPAKILCPLFFFLPVCGMSKRLASQAKMLAHFRSHCLTHEAHPCLR